MANTLGQELRYLVLEASEQQAPAPKVLADPHGLPEEPVGIVAGRPCSEDDRGGASVKELADHGRYLGRIALVVKGETSETGLGRPVWLRPGEPGGKQAEHKLGGVPPIL